MNKSFLLLLGIPALLLIISCRKETEKTPIVTWESPPTSTVTFSPTMTPTYTSTSIDTVTETPTVTATPFEDAEYEQVLDPDNLILILPRAVPSVVAENIQQSIKTDLEESQRNAENPDRVVFDAVDIRVLKGPRPYQSLVVRGLWDDAGAHSLEQYYVFTYDAHTGRFLNLPELFIANMDWKHELWKRVCESWRDNLRNAGPQDCERRYIDAAGVIKKFSLDDKSLTLYFDQCVVGPCSGGIRKIQVSFKNLSTILQPAFRNILCGSNGTPTELSNARVGNQAP